MDSAEAFLYALFLVMLFFVWVRVRIEFLNNKKYVEIIVIIACVLIVGGVIGKAIYRKAYEI